MLKMKPTYIVLHVIIVLHLSLCELGLFAQSELNLRLKPKPSGTVYQKNNNYKGSEFLFDEWQPGELHLKNGQILGDLWLNYNAYTDDVVYSIQGNSSVVVSKYQLHGFKIMVQSFEKTFILSERDSVLRSGFSTPTFLEVLYNGKNKVYSQRVFMVNNLLVKDNPFNKSVYYSKDTYFVSTSGVLIDSPHRKNSYYFHFGKSVIKEIIRSKNLSLKKEEDLVSFISELDVL